MQLVLLFQEDGRTVEFRRDAEESFIPFYYVDSIY